MFWKIAGGVLVLAAGAYGLRRYVLKHRHVDTCPTADQVRQVVSDLDANIISVTAAQLRADAWEHDGCQIAADAVRAMVKVHETKDKLIGGASKIGDAIVNWIPGCTPPAGFLPPIDWILGTAPTSTIPGWTIPTGWKVGDPLPTGATCPAGWTSSTAKAIESSPTSSPITSGYSSSPPIGTRAKIMRMLRPGGAPKMLLVAPTDYSRGLVAGDAYCERAHAGGASEAPPAELYKSSEFKRGFYDGKERCEKRHAAKPPVFNTDYEDGRAEAQRQCAFNKNHSDEKFDLIKNAASGRSADWNRGFSDGVREAGCDPGTSKGMIDILLAR